MQLEAGALDTVARCRWLIVGGGKRGRRGARSRCWSFCQRTFSKSPISSHSPTLASYRSGGQPAQFSRARQISTPPGRLRPPHASWHIPACVGLRKACIDRRNTLRETCHVRRFLTPPGLRPFAQESAQNMTSPGTYPEAVDLAGTRPRLKVAVWGQCQTPKTGARSSEHACATSRSPNDSVT
jgi:hypothetical protein